jgi:outer membrane lipoprotein-sorting protein
MKTLLACAVVGAAILLSVFGTPAAEAAAPVAVTLNSQDQADLKRIEAYLENIKTLKADFLQTNEDGSTSQGQVWLSRPGKMRFTYQPPVQLQIVSNGDYVAVNDTELKHVDFYPVESTPVWFLLREGIKLSGDVTVTRIERGGKTLRIDCVQTKDPGNGSLTLVFSDDPLQLRQWTVVDQQGHVTKVALENVEVGGALDTAMFKLPANPNQNATPGQSR